jgi:hypothetical protein
MKAKLIISLNEEPFQETELELYENVKYENLSPALTARRLEESVTINEKRVRQVIARAINDHPLRFAGACCWDAVLQVPSRMNECG